MAIYLHLDLLKKNRVRNFNTPEKRSKIILNWSWLLIYQEIIEPNTGDCLRACVASMLELPLDAVPNFMRLNSLGIINWFHAYTKKQYTDR